MGVERVLVPVALVEQPLLRVGRILRDVELLAAGLTLETTLRMLLGERAKIPGATQRTLNSATTAIIDVPPLDPCLGFSRP